MPYQTVIVEDNPMVAMLNRAYVEQDARFQVAGEFHNGRDALSFLLAHPADLVILDVFLPLLTGPELLRELRSRNNPCDVIMVTAAHDTHTLEDLLHLGVLDYLVKPFTAERFHQALELFCRHREAIHSRTQVDQRDIDQLLSASLSPQETPVPKGLQEKTLTLIRQALSRSDSGATCEALSDAVGLSTVTVRRYLRFMVDHGEALSTINYDTGGRPSVLYSSAHESHTSN